MSTPIKRKSDSVGDGFQHKRQPISEGLSKTVEEQAQQAIAVISRDPPRSQRFVSATALLSMKEVLGKLDVDDLVELMGVSLRLNNVVQRHMLDRSSGLLQHVPVSDIMNAASSIQELDLSSLSDINSIERMLRQFPNVTHLKLPQWFEDKDLDFLQDFPNIQFVDLSKPSQGSDTGLSRFQVLE